MFLQWILDHVEKCRYPDDPLMRIILPIMLQYAKEFVQNELLSRKLAYQCAKKVTYLVNETEAMTQPQQAQAGNEQHHQTHPVISAFLELTNDPYSRFIILGLSSILQTIATECSTALVWHYFGENKTPTSLLGSPLDYLPNCAPSALPMPPRQNNQEIRHRIRECEQFIKERSHAVESKNAKHLKLKLMFNNWFQADPSASFNILQIKSMIAKQTLLIF
jgi:mediator of RNA polymerase II transcription subunit 12